jgi:hypothetical protein
VATHQGVGHAVGSQEDHGRAGDRRTRHGRPGGHVVDIGGRRGPRQRSAPAPRSRRGSEILQLVGDTDSYLIQTGTEADVVNGKPHYDAWWEVITPTNPAPEVVYTAITVHAGDAITATVAKGTAGKWTMTLKDITAGKTGTHTAAFAGPGESAEWIQEDTDVNGVISPAPDWQKVSFKKITVNGVSPKLTFSQSVDIYDSHNTQEDRTAAPTGGNAFTVTWLATGTGTPT